MTCNQTAISISSSSNAKTCCTIYMFIVFSKGLSKTAMERYPVKGYLLWLALVSCCNPMCNYFFDRDLVANSHSGSYYIITMHYYSIVFNCNKFTRSIIIVHYFLILLLCGVGFGVTCTEYL